MKERKLTASIKTANILSVVILALVALVAAIIWKVNWNTNQVAEVFPIEKGEPLNFLWRMFAFVVAMVMGIVVHELIHGITWACFAETKWKSISFGILWKSLTPYCHCNQPLKVRHYMVGSLMPLFVVGIVPLIAGLAVGWYPAVVFGVLFTASAAGDIIISWKLRKEPSENTVLDHPTELGCIIYEEE